MQRVDNADSHKLPKPRLAVKSLNVAWTTMAGGCRAYQALPRANWPGDLGMLTLVWGPWETF